MKEAKDKMIHHTALNDNNPAHIQPCVSPQVPTEFERMEMGNLSF